MRPDNASTEHQFYHLQYIFWLGEMISSRVEDVLESLWISDH